MRISGRRRSEDSIVLDFLLDWLVPLLPWRIFWKLFAVFIIGCALFYWWAKS